MFEDWEEQAEAAVDKSVKESDKQKVEGEQRTREWFRARIGKFTGSNIHKLMGKTDLKKGIFGSGAITYIMSVMNERTMTEEAIEVYIDDMMAKEFKQTNWGIENEPIAIKRFEKETGLKVTDTRFKPNEERPYFGGSTDGMASDDNPCEIKCPFDGSKHLKNRDFMLMGGVPEDHEHYTQFQSHMANNDAKKTHFVSFDPRQQEKYQFVHVEVERNQEYINTMLSRIDQAELAINMCMDKDISIAEALEEVKHLESEPLRATISRKTLDALKADKSNDEGDYSDEVYTINVTDQTKDMKVGDSIEFKNPNFKNKSEKS